MPLLCSVGVLSNQVRSSHLLPHFARNASFPLLLAQRTWRLHFCHRCGSYHSNSFPYYCRYYVGRLLPPMLLTLLLSWSWLFAGNVSQKYTPSVKRNTSSRWRSVKISVLSMTHCHSPVFSSSLILCTILFGKAGNVTFVHWRSGDWRTAPAPLNILSFNIVVAFSYSAATISFILNILRYTFTFNSNPGIVLND